MKIYGAPEIDLISRQVFLLPHGYESFKAHGVWGTEPIAEFSGRLCYMSFGDGKKDGHKTVRGRSDTQAYFGNILKQGHGAVLEHSVLGFLWQGVSRSLTHEQVRHRAGFSYSQLSQRYVDESEVGFVLPPAIHPQSIEFGEWAVACDMALKQYKSIIAGLASHMDVDSTKAKKIVRQTARSVLPNCTETKIVVTGNLRSWRNWLVLRGSAAADDEMRRLAVAMVPFLQAEAPNIFQDVSIQTADGKQYVNVEYTHV